MMIAKSPEAVIITAIIAKDDELLRYLHILDTLAYESLTAQLKYFEKKIRNQEPSVILNLKRIASKKYMCFFEIKKSLLKSSDFIDINKFEISNKNELYNMVIRSNITHFFNLLFTNFDPAVPDLQKVDIKSFFNYVVPPTLMQSEAIWDLDLNLRVQIYISTINKNPQKNMYRTIFPNVVEGPPMYKETYTKVRKIIKRSSEDVDTLMKEFKWGRFVEEMFKYLVNIFTIVNEVEIPLLYKYTSVEDSHVSSTSSTNIVEDASRKEINSNAKKRRLADTEGDDDILSDNLGDTSSFSKKEEIVQKMSHVDINGSQSLERSQSDLILISDGESHTPTSNRRITRSERDNKSNNSKRRATIPMRKTIERSSSSLTNMIVDQPELVDDKRTSSEESFTEGNPSFEEIEGSSSKEHDKKSAVDNADHIDNEEAKRITKRIKNMWTDEELAALEEGMRDYGKQWTSIKKHDGENGRVLENRTASQLKDKARSEFHRRVRECIEPGVFAIINYS